MSESGNVWMQKSFFEVTKKQALEAGAESSDPLYDWQGLELNMEELSVSDGKINVYAKFTRPNYSGEGIYVSFDIPLTAELLSEIIAHATKQYNKMKTSFEAIK